MSTVAWPVQLDFVRTETVRVAQRNETYELLRIAAALGVVWFHCNAPARSLGYAGLPALIALSLGLASAPGKANPISVSMTKRAKRLLLPWAFWCFAYGALKLVKTRAAGLPINDLLSDWTFMTGPAIHLWYLPFAFIVTSLGGLIRASALSTDQVVVPWSVSAVAASTGICSWLLETATLPAPFSQWIFAIPAVLVGVCLPHSSDESKRILRVVVLLLAVIIGCVATRSVSLSTPYIVGTAVLGAAWLIRIPAIKYVIWLGGLSFGIYLVHPLVQSIVTRMVSSNQAGLVALLVMAISLILTAGLQRTPLKCVI